MGKNNTAQLKLAESFLGEGSARFCRYCGIPVGSAFCCAYVSTIFGMAGNAEMFCNGRKEVNCPRALDWCYDHLASIPIYLAMPSDIIFFDWNDNEVADHIGFVKERLSDVEVKTIEGNTGGGIVAYRTRKISDIQAVFRPDFPAKFDTDKVLEIDGQFGYNSIACLQKALGVKKVDGILGQQTVKALQAKVGVKQDGSWGVKTSKAVQKKLCGFTGDDVDGWFGNKSVKALQRWINSRRKRVVKIGQATCDERGKATGGKAGDQTGREVAISNWSYSKTPGAWNHWDKVLRAKDPKIAEKIAKSMKDACANDRIGYDLSSSDRGTLYDEAKRFGWDLSKIKVKCETSCVDLVSVCLNSAGIKTPKYWASKNVYKDLMATRKFECLVGKAYVASSDKLKPGDILNAPDAPHTAMVVEVTEEWK